MDLREYKKDMKIKPMDPIKKIKLLQKISTVTLKSRR